MIVVLAVVSLLGLTSLAMGHDWYPRDCCSARDCKPVRCEEIIYEDGMMRYGGLVFTKEKQHPSQDSRCHVCARAVPYGLRQPMCIFVTSGA